MDSSAPRVVTGDAAEFVDDLRLVEGVTTVLWHSVFWQYLPNDSRDRLVAAIDSLAGAAGPSAGFAHLRLEPGREDTGLGGGFEVRLRVGRGADRLFGTAPPHGVPVTWSDAPRAGG